MGDLPATRAEGDDCRLPRDPLAWAGGSLLLGAAAVILLAPWPIALAGVPIYLLIAARLPLAALGLVVISLPFYLLGRPVGRLEFSPTEIGIALAAGAAALRALWSLPGRRHPTATSDRRSPALVLAAGAGTASSSDADGGFESKWRSPFLRAITAWVGDPTLAATAICLVLAGALSLTASVALRESLRSFRTILVEPALFYFLVVTQVRRRRELLALAWALILAGVLISLVGLAQYLTNQNIITAEEGLRRIRGFYGSPNNLALFLGRPLPLALALLLWRREGRIVLAGATLVMAAALVLTFSAGAWVAVGLSALVVAALRGERSRRIAAIAAVVGLGGLGVAALRIPRIGSHFDLQSGTGVIRLEVWRSALHMLADHPLRGIGLDNFLYYYQHGYRLPDAWREPDLSHPHNLILDFWLSLGLPGLLLLLLGVGRFATLVRRAWARPDPTDRALIAGALGAMVDTVVHGLVDNSFFLVDLAVLFWLTFAIVAIACRVARPEAQSDGLRALARLPNAPINRPEMKEKG